MRMLGSFAVRFLKLVVVEVYKLKQSSGHKTKLFGKLEEKVVTVSTGLDVGISVDVVRLHLAPSGDCRR